MVDDGWQTIFTLTFAARTARKKIFAGVIVFSTGRALDGRPALGTRFDCGCAHAARYPDAVGGAGNAGGLIARTVARLRVGSDHFAFVTALLIITLAAHFAVKCLGGV